MYILGLDAETLYDDQYSLSKLSTEEYVRDPRFELIGMGIRNADNTARVWLEADQFRQWAAAQDWSQIALLGFHCHFDGLILAHHFNVRPAFWFDPLCMAYACRPQYRRKSLAKLAEQEELGRKGDEVIHAKGKRRRDFSQQEWQQYGAYCLNDIDLTFALFDRFKPEFSIDELRIIDTTIRMFTEPSLALDPVVLAEHHASEIARKRTLLERCGADKADLMSNEKFADLLLQHGVEPPLKFSEAKTKSAQEKDPNAAPVYSFSFAKTDPGMKALLEHENEEVAWLAAARVGVKSTGDETRAKRLLGISTRGLWPVYLHYHKAHTGRWSGGDKVNAQNLRRGGALRNAVLAPGGHQIVVCDSAQIEARVLAWLACETWLVKAFAEGRDVYSEFASVAYQRPITKENKTERFVGKTCILGLGYGLGAPKFAATMLAGAMGGSPVQFGRDLLESMHVDYNKYINNPKWVNKMRAVPTRLGEADFLVHALVAEAFVQRYRQKNKAIGFLWEMGDTALEAMSRGQEIDFGFNGILHTRKDALVLPSGRVLHYPDLTYDKGYTYWNGAERTKAYGSYIIENAVQALARDIIAQQMLAYIDTGRRVASTSHDEVIALTTDTDAPFALNTLLSIMKTPPTWAPGLPLNAEGSFAGSYGQCK